MAAAAPSRKLRVLALHGFMQTEASYRGTSASLRRCLKRWAEFEYVQAPFRVTPPGFDESSGAPPPPAYSWWKTSEDRSRYEGWDEAVEVVRRAFVDRGPFDGVLGFSQGACCVAMLAAMQARRDAGGEGGLALPPEVRFRFAVMVGGFVPRAHDLSGLVDEVSPVRLPSLHVVGETDRMVEPQRSKELAARFENATIVSHPGGHYCPTSAAFSAQYRDFLAKQAQQE